MNIFNWMMKMKKIKREFENDAVVKSIRQAIRTEVERNFKKKDLEITILVLSKLIQDSRIEITLSRRENNVILAKKNRNEK